MTSRQRVRKLPTRNANRDAEAQAEIRNNQSAAGAPPTPDITHELRCHLCMCRHCVLVSPRRLVSMHDIIRDAPYHSVLYEITISLLKAWEQNINSLKGKSPYYCKFTSIFCCHMLPDSSCDVQPTATSTHKASYLITLVIMVFKQRHEPLYIIVTIPVLPDSIVSLFCQSIANRRPHHRTAATTCPAPHFYRAPRSPQSRALRFYAALCQLRTAQI